MNIQVREKQKGSGVFWVFVHYQGRQREIRGGPRVVANKIADRLRVKLATDPGFIFDNGKAIHQV